MIKPGPSFASREFDRHSSRPFGQHTPHQHSPAQTMPILACCPPKALQRSPKQPTQGPRQNRREAIEAVPLRTSETVNQQSSSIMEAGGQSHPKPQQTTPAGTEYLRPGDYRNLTSDKSQPERSQRPLINCDTRASKDQGARTNTHPNHQF